MPRFEDLEYESYNTPEEIESTRKYLKRIMPTKDILKEAYKDVEERLCRNTTAKDNPKLDRWRIVKQWRAEGYKHCIVELQYPDCTNYEGRKILVFDENKFDEVIRFNKGLIDPHFSDDNRKYLHPIARFAPNKEGWIHAASLIHLLNGNYREAVALNENT